MSLKSSSGLIRVVCLDREFGSKVKALFPDAEALERSKDFKRAIELWATFGSLTDMTSERLLASYNQACRETAPEIERYAATGLLTQLLSEHRRLGRPDPRVTSRRDSIASGLGINAAKGKSVALSSSKPTSSYFLFEV